MWFVCWSEHSESDQFYSLSSPEAEPEMRDICETSWLSVSKWSRTKGRAEGWDSAPLSDWEILEQGEAREEGGWKPAGSGSQSDVMLSVVPLDWSLISIWHQYDIHTTSRTASTCGGHSGQGGQSPTSTISLPQISSVPRKLFTASLKSISRYSSENISIST